MLKLARSFAQTVALYYQTHQRIMRHQCHDAPRKDYLKASQDRLEDSLHSTRTYPRSSREPRRQTGTSTLTRGSSSGGSDGPSCAPPLDLRWRETYLAP